MFSRIFIQICCKLNPQVLSQFNNNDYLHITSPFRYIPGNVPGVTLSLPQHKKTCLPLINDRNLHTSCSAARKDIQTVFPRQNTTRSVASARDVCSRIADIYICYKCYSKTGSDWSNLLQCVRNTGCPGLRYTKIHAYVLVPKSFMQFVFSTVTQKDFGTCCSSTDI